MNGDLVGLCSGRDLDGSIVYRCAEGLKIALQNISSLNLDQNRNGLNIRGVDNYYIWAFDCKE
jgi:hypothetical protein